MKEELFIKGHPSLKGLVITVPLKLVSPVGDSAGMSDLITIENIHETQIDKQKVKKAFEKLENCKCVNCKGYGTKKHYGLLC